MTKTKIMRPPLPTGFLTFGTTIWPVSKIVCPGYKTKGNKVECGIVFESTSGTTERCQKCRKLHNREYHRVYKRTRKA